MIKPTVGRVVWYWSEGLVPDGVQPHAALVTFVHNDECVNLAVFNKAGEQSGACSVHLHQDEKKPRPSTAHATWMPFQVGQAKAQAAASSAPASDASLVGDSDPASPPAEKEKPAASKK